MKRVATVMGALVLAGTASGVLAMGSTSCAPAPDSERMTDVLQPDYATYKEWVDPYLQRRCGTLDCHGQPGRAYRIFGFAGLRRSDIDAGVDEGLVSGVHPTQELEIQANFQSAVALEPEQMSRVIAKQGQDIETLLLVRKPLLLERHKGGPAMSDADDGYRCVEAWLQIRTVRPTADGIDFEVIPENERDQLSDQAKRWCLNAQSMP